MVHSDFGSDSVELCSVLALSLSTAGGIIRLFLDAQVYLSTWGSEICVASVSSFWFPYLRNKGWHNAAAKVDQALQVREY